MRIRPSHLARAALVGVGATAVMDVAGELLRRTTGVPPLDYALLGRWIGHLRGGTYRHEAIGAAAPVPHEREIGWAAHYAIGTGFATAFVALHPGWLDRPTLAPALALGVGTVAAPWFVMQPAFGLGPAASRTPRPTLARARSLRAHAIYGAGIWLSGKAVHAVRGRFGRG